jgi:hypothetical protein
MCVNREEEEEAGREVRERGLLACEGMGDAEGGKVSEAAGGETNFG